MKREERDPPPAEVICVLDMMDVLRMGFSVSPKARKRTLDKIAIDLIERGEPFVYHGRRFPGAAEGEPTRNAKSQNAAAASEEDEQ